MRLTLTRRGGLAGLRLPPLVVDSAALTSPDAGRLEGCAAAVRAEAAHPPASPRAGTVQPDRFSYTLTLSDAINGDLTLQFDETTATAAQAALVAAIEQLAPRPAA